MASLIKGIKTLFGDVEMAPYTITHEREGYEERLYPAKKWVCTSLKGAERSELRSAMFRKLFTYISGKNKENIRIDMTSPVITFIATGSEPNVELTFKMGFFIPEEHQKDPPEPGDETIHFEERPEMRVLTRRFGGYATDEIIAREAAELAGLLRKHEEDDVDYEHYYVAGYDPPFKPLSRRNEVWYIKTAHHESEKTDQ